MRIETDRERKRGQAGIGSVELVLVMALIAVVFYWGGTALLEGGKGKLEEANYRKTARAVVQVCVAGQSAGVDFVRGRSVEATLDRIAEGRQVTSGSFTGVFFGMPELDAKTRKEVSKYLRISNGTLEYAGQS